MGQSATIEQRVEKLERELTALKRRLERQPDDPENWIKRISGSFAGDEDFGEILQSRSFTI